ncbi:uncharacterized protein LOC112342165 [Selaginella moellendorffii]|uniref:uncharacterized protein LOC112342165 n=1 Tax=Selaginella moellendorffii TaxID=88036 RepID=UPI000D1C4FF6|nr:uncharacterized protein LOC112342165 [Selaginella moellendorffii]|eukprot:XP_024519325.1 uncharacterized protein LOC112342165 [Selaginella moellendorffii]
MRMAHGAPMQGRKRSLKGSEKASEANQNLRVYRRFFVALILSKLVQAARARCLYKAGLRTVEVVAEATIPELANALCDSSFKEHAGWLFLYAFTGKLFVIDAGKQQWMYGAAARKIVNGAGRIVLDRAEEARIATFSWSNDSAFSAFQVLGATIPHSLSQSLDYFLGPNSYFLLEQRFRILGLSSSWSNDSAFAVAVLRGLRLRQTRWPYLQSKMRARPTFIALTRKTEQ